MALPGGMSFSSPAVVTDMAFTLARRSCAMLCLFLVLWFAAIQGSNAVDRIQHISSGDMLGDHRHALPGLVTLDEVEAHVDAQAEAPGADMAGLPSGHHHHNADHGSGLPAQFLTEDGVRADASSRIGIPQVAAVTGMIAPVMERPPKLPAIA